MTLRRETRHCGATHIGRVNRRVVKVFLQPVSIIHFNEEVNFHNSEGCLLPRKNFLPSLQDERIDSAGTRCIYT